MIRRTTRTSVLSLIGYCDYWEITLPDELATSASRSPSLFGYLAALSILDAQVLFSKMRCAELFDPSLAGGRVKVERHHLFPRKHLEGLGITDVREVNQIANLAVLEWHDNLAISATDPAIDGFQQALVQVLATHLGTDVAASVRIHVTKVGPDGRDVALVDCPAHGHPVYLLDGGQKEFHVRAANTTRLMDVEEAHSYISQHWKGRD